MTGHGTFRQRPIRKCIFCLTNKADSREHAFPNWTLKRLLKPEDDFSGTYGHDHLNAHSHGQKQIRVRCVCQPCNTGWMKDLEDRVLPFVERMINDERCPLAQDQQKDLAMWAMKTAMVFDVLRDRELPMFYSDASRSQLRASARIQPHTLIWIARNGAVAQGNKGVFTDVYSVFVRQNPVTVQASITTFGYRHLLIQIVTIDAQPMGNNFVMLPTFPGPWDVVTERIWPARTVADWPPLMSIPVEAFFSFLNRFKIGSSATPQNIGSKYFPNRSQP